MIEEKLSLLIAAITENTAALNAVLAAGGAPDVKVVHTITPAEKPAAKGKAKAAPAPEPEPEVVETPVPENPVTEETPETQEPAPAAEIDTDAVIADSVESFKAHMVAAADDAERKAFLKEQFEALRNKYGLAPGAKLITLAPTPEKLTGLLADIKAL